MGTLKADNNYKRKCLILFLVMFAAGGLLIALGLPRFKQFFTSKTPEEAISIVVYSLVVVQFLFLVPFGLYLCFFAQRVLKSEQFPPPGQKVFKDTPIQRGTNAKLRSYILFAGGILIIVFAVIFTLVFPPLFYELALG